MIFSNMVELGFFGAHTNTKPARSRWWSMTGALAAQVCACSAYGVLPAALHRAFPTWEAGAPIAPPGMEIVDDHRKMMRSKTWRAKLFTERLALRRLSMSVLFLAEPIEHLAMRVQFETGCGDTLLSLLHPHSNPLHEAQSAYCKLLLGAPQDSHLAILFYFFGCGLDAARELAELLFGIGVECSAKIWYMIEVSLQEMPFPFARLADARTDAAAKRRVVEQLFRKPWCEVDPGMGAKLRRFFGGPDETNDETKAVDDLLNDQALMDGLRLWATSCNLENMCLERLLALIRNTLPDKMTSSAERVVSSGFLAQVLSKHKEVGGSEPWLLRRSDLVARGVPTKANAKAKGKRYGKRPWMFYADERVLARKATVGMGTRSAYYMELKQWAAEFNLLSKEDKQSYEEMARVAADNHATKREMALKMAEDCQETPDEAYRRLVGQKLWGLSSQQQPIRADVIDEFARKDVKEVGTSRAGFTGMKVSI